MTAIDGLSKSSGEAREGIHLRLPLEFTTPITFGDARGTLIEPAVLNSVGGFVLDGWFIHADATRT